jgi:hypothetical protein
MAMKEEVLAVIDMAPNTYSGEDELSLSVSAVEAKANAVVVTNDLEYQEAAAFGRLLKTKAAEVTEFFKPIKDAAHKTHKQICDREKAMLKPISAAEKAVKAAMGKYATAKLMEQQRLEAQLRQQAQAESDRLLAQAAELESKGMALQSNAVFAQAQMADAAARSIALERSAPKAGGISTTTDWQIIGIDAAQVPVDINGCVIRPVDEAAIMRLIRASKGKVIIPGVKYQAIAKVAIRK